MRVVVGVPCHRDEPGLAATLESLEPEVKRLVEAGHEVGTLVVINGVEPADGPAVRDAAAAGDSVQVVLVGRPSKVAAWNRIRSEPAEVTIFVDADVEVAPGSLPALVDAIGTGRWSIVGADQVPRPPRSLAARVAEVPHRRRWTALAGTLYAARRDDLPTRMPEVLLDDGWLHGTMGEHATTRIDEAVATFELPASWRDLWRQRRRAEAGKAELRSLGVPLVGRAEPGLRPGAPRGPRVAVRLLLLALVRLAARSAGSLSTAAWRPLASTKSDAGG